MAIAQVDSWSVEQRSRWTTAGLEWPLVQSLVMRSRLQDRRARKPIAFVLTLVVHLVVLVFLGNRALNVLADAPDLEQRVMSVISLSNTVSQAPSDAEQATASAAPPQPVTQVPQPVIAPEWSVAKIRIARIQASNSAQGLAGTDFDPSGLGGGGAYDPYAGAALQKLDRSRLEPANARPAILPQGRETALDAAALDGAALDRAVQKLRERLPTSRGSIEIEADLDATGTVIKARMVGGTASAQVGLFACQWLIGKRIGHRSGQRIRLSTVVLR